MARRSHTVPKSFPPTSRLDKRLLFPRYVFCGSWIYRCLLHWSSRLGHRQTVCHRFYPSQDHQTSLRVNLWRSDLVTAAYCDDDVAQRAATLELDMADLNGKSNETKVTKLFDSLCNRRTQPGDSWQESVHTARLSGQGTQCSCAHHARLSFV